MKHRDDPSVLRSQAESLGVSLPLDRAELLLGFETMLRERAVPAGMVSAADEPRLRERHVLDCLRAVPEVLPSDERALDLGSGAGLPGVIVAIARPELHVGLVEVRRHRVAFLELVLERLGIGNAEVQPVRIQELTTPVDLCFARALAPLPQAWRLAEPLLLDRGRLVYFAGRTARGPLEGPSARAEVRTTAVLESAGPLVIMAR